MKTSGLCILALVCDTAIASEQSLIVVAESQGLADLAELTIAAERREFVLGSFEDRADLAELADEMLAHEVSRSSAQPSVQISYRFRGLEQAEQACDSVVDLDARVSFDGINARCSVSMHGYPSLSLLTQLREAAAPVSSHGDAHPGGWHVIGEKARDQAE